MKTILKIWKHIHSLPEERRRLLALIVVVLLAIIIFILWGSSRIIKLENPGETTLGTDDLDKITAEDPRAAEILSPFQGLVDSLKNLKELLPDKPKENGYVKEIKNLAHKTWETTYKYLP